jgi:hypothetical protein
VSKSKLWGGKKRCASGVKIGKRITNPLELLGGRRYSKCVLHLRGN